MCRKEEDAVLPGGLAVGYDLETVLGLQLQQLGHLVEDVGDLAVLHGRNVGSVN